MRKFYKIIHNADSACKAGKIWYLVPYRAKTLTICKAEVVSVSLSTSKETDSYTPHYVRNSITINFKILNCSNPKYKYKKTIIYVNTHLDINDHKALTLKKFFKYAEALEDYTFMYFPTFESLKSLFLEDLNIQNGYNEISTQALQYEIRCRQEKLKKLGAQKEQIEYEKKASYRQLTMIKYGKF